MKGKRNSISTKHCEEGVGEDRISKLPDSLIHEILSYIDVKFVVRTSALSKRWKNVWISLPFVKSGWTSFIQGYSNSNSDIQVIRLGFLVLNDTLVETLNRWILEAVNHNVQELTIIAVHFPNPNSTYEIPHQLLNCKSLKTLSFTFISQHFDSYTNVILPKSMSLPQIKKLSLNGISVSNLELQRLFSSCPPMEMVVIQNCDVQMNNQRNIIIDSHSLQFFLAINSLTCTTKISAPIVKDFRCTGFMTEDFSLENFSSLVGAHLNMRLRKPEAYETAETYSELSTEEKEVFAKRMMKYLGAVHKVHHLTLSYGFLEVLLHAPGSLDCEPTQLCDLETLKLEMSFTRGCLRSIAYLLKISPILMSLILTSKESNLAEVGDDWEAGLSLTCMFSHLKSVEIREVEGFDNELKFLKFLLKNSMVLEKLVLFFRSR